MWPPGKLNDAAVPLVTRQPLHGASLGDGWSKPYVWLLSDWTRETCSTSVAVLLVLSGHGAVVLSGDRCETGHASEFMCGRSHLLAPCEVAGIGASCGAPRGMRGVEASDDVVGRASAASVVLIESIAVAGRVCWLRVQQQPSPLMLGDNTKPNWRSSPPSLDRRARGRVHRSGGPPAHNRASVQIGTGSGFKRCAKPNKTLLFYITGDPELLVNTCQIVGISRQSGINSSISSRRAKKYFCRWLTVATVATVAV